MARKGNNYRILLLFIELLVSKLFLGRSIRAPEPHETKHRQSCFLYVFSLCKCSLDARRKRRHIKFMFKIEGKFLKKILQNAFDGLIICTKKEIRELCAKTFFYFEDERNLMFGSEF